VAEHPSSSPRAEERGVQEIAPASGPAHYYSRGHQNYQDHAHLLVKTPERYYEGQVMNKARIMIVDDDPDLRLALSVRLRANNFDTVNVCDGYSALAMALKETPNLIILDLGLPAGDGFAVLKHVKEYPALSCVPIIVLTGRDPGGNKKRSFESGAVAFFQKPADEAELMGVIRTHLSSAWGWGTLPS
jgi:CheY-like chemotaxis protein